MVVSLRGAICAIAPRCKMRENLLAIISRLFIVFTDYLYFIFAYGTVITS